MVAFSSTVIPESEMKSEELTAKMDLEYKKAFYGLFKKKFNSKLEKADTLMTGKLMIPHLFTTFSFACVFRFSIILDKKKFDKNPEKYATKKLQ